MCLRVLSVAEITPAERGERLWEREYGEEKLLRVDLYHCRAEGMQSKAETFKHETHFSPPKKELLFCLQSLRGKVEGPKCGGREE